MITKYEKFKMLGESVWSDFIDQWEESHPNKEVPTRGDMPFQMGDQTVQGKIMFIDNLHRDKDGKLVDPLVKADTHFKETGKFLRASELEPAEAEEIPETASDHSDLKPEVDFPTVMSLDTRVCTIVEAERIPKKDRLIKLVIDTGFGKKEVITNLGQDFDTPDFLNKNMYFILNLAPAKIAGNLSEAMIVAATTPDGKPQLVESDLPVGTKLIG